MAAYRAGQLVESCVERVLPYGVFVRLDDDTQAYIRRRELDLDQDVEPARVVREGEKITAKVIALGETGKHIELSRRACLPDPWPEFARRLREGVVVQGSVRALRAEGVFVRVETGINGFVPLAELATWPVPKPEELLWVGDEIEAVITHLDAHTQRLTLSIKERIGQRAQVTRIIEKISVQKAECMPATLVATRGELPPITTEERERIGQIVVIDDDDGIRNGLVNWLKQRGYHAYAAQTGEEVLAQIQPGGRGVLLVDIHLSDGDGLELIQHLRLNSNGVFVCVMSSPEWLLERSDDIRAAKVFQVFEKPLNKDDIDQFLRHLARGETIQPAWKLLPRRKDERNESQASDLALHDVSPTQRLRVALERLVEMARAEKGIVFVKDPISHTISIAAEAGALPIRPEALYCLGESPVKDVIVENELVVEGHATASSRFRKLTDVTAFESCIGAPIEMMGEVHHALFFFHRKPDAFARVRQQYVETDALWLTAILEEQTVRDRLRTMNPLLLSGELAIGLAHEVYNKVDSLDLQLTNLLSATHTSTDLRAALSNLQTSTIGLKTLAGSFQQMMQTKDMLTTFDLNDIVRRAEMLVRPLARRERVKTDLHLADSLPQVTGNSIALQQVFFNIMLNAVQQLALKPDKHRLLEISTLYQPEYRKRPLLIRFADTGPGIHKQLWEKIFELGFSTRGGSGLGLFIARSLIEMFDGKVMVEESAVPLGSTFLVKLPVASEGKER